jgi:hypothetical protein
VAGGEQEGEGEEGEGRTRGGGSATLRSPEELPARCACGDDAANPRKRGAGDADPSQATTGAARASAPRAARGVRALPLFFLEREKQDFDGPSTRVHSLRVRADSFGREEKTTNRIGNGGDFV